MSLSRNQIHTQVYEYTLILIAVSLPLSIFTSSMFQLLLLANYLVELRYREKWKMLVTNRALLIFLLIFALHVVGLLWSSDLSYAMRDFKIKLPLLAFPVIIATSAPLSTQQVRRILLFFSLGYLRHPWLRYLNSPACFGAGSKATATCPCSFLTSVFH